MLIIILGIWLRVISSALVPVIVKLNMHYIIYDNRCLIGTGARLGYDLFHIEIK